MNSEFSDRLPWISLGLLWFTHASLGWYLAVHHVLWLVGIGAIVVMLILTGAGGALLRQISWFTSRSLFIAISVSVLLSITIFLFVTDFQFLGLIFLPAMTMFLADLELRSAGFSERRTLLLLAGVAGLGVGIGELVDLILLPSMRF